MAHMPKTRAHHDEQHSIGVKSFQARHGVDLRAEADRTAFEHPRPLGIRGLADRWAVWDEHWKSWGKWSQHEVMQDSGALPPEEPGPEDLDTYEVDALSGWVRREVERETERRKPFEDGGSWEYNADDPDAVATHIAYLIGGIFADRVGLARALCDWAQE